MAHPFLSDPWFEAVEALRAEAPEPSPTVKDLVLNITVQGAPDGDCDVRLQAGQFRRGHADDAPTTVTVPYDIARKIFIDGDQQAGMQAFMSGQIKVTGDMTKLMAMQAGGPPTPEQQEFQKKLQALTA